MKNNRVWMVLPLVAVTLNSSGAQAARTAAARHSSGMDRLSELRLQNPDASPYRILKLLFDESKDPITADDLARLGKNCAGANEEDKTPYVARAPYRVVINRVLEPGKPAQPGMGPLFPPQPATPDRVESKEIVVLASDAVDRATMNYLFESNFDGVRTEASRSEIVTTIDKLKGYVDLPVVIKFRRNGNLLSHEFRSNVSMPGEAVNYNYCWE